MFIIDFKKFMNIFIFFAKKPREVTSRNINRKFDEGAWGSLLCFVYLVSLYSRDFVALVLSGQVNSVTVNVPLVLMAVSGLIRSFY